MPVVNAAFNVQLDNVFLQNTQSEIIPPTGFDPVTFRL
jgi:hypothetical protein